MCLPFCSCRCQSKPCYVTEKGARGIRIYSSVRNLKPIGEIGNNFPAAVLCSVTPLRKRHGVFIFLRTALLSTPVITFGQSIGRNLCKQKWDFQSRSEICPTFDWSELWILTMLVQHHHPTKILCGNAETLAGLALERERGRGRKWLVVTPHLISDW